MARPDSVKGALRDVSGVPREDAVHLRPGSSPRDAPPPASADPGRDDGEESGAESQGGDRTRPTEAAPPGSSPQKGSSTRSVCVRKRAAGDRSARRARVPPTDRVPGGGREKDKRENSAARASTAASAVANADGRRKRKKEGNRHGWGEEEELDETASSATRSQNAEMATGRKREREEGRDGEPRGEDRRRDQRRDRRRRPRRRRDHKPRHEEASRGAGRDGRSHREDAGRQGRPPDADGPSDGEGRRRDRRGDETEAATRAGAVRARPTSPTGSARDEDGGEKRAAGGREDQVTPPPPPPPHTGAQGGDAEKTTGQTDATDSLFEKLPKQMDRENSYSEKPTEPLHTEDSYSERHPEQIHNFDFYSDKSMEPLHTEDSPFEKLAEQMDGENSSSEKPTEPLHTEDSYSERHPEQMHHRQSYFERLPEQMDGENSYSEKPTEPLLTEDSYSESRPKQIHNCDFCFEKLPEQKDSENSYSEKPREPLHTQESYSEKVPEQIYHRDTYFEKLPQQIDAENSYSEKPTEPLHTQDSYADKVPQQIHHREFYFEKLPEQIDLENSYSEKPTEPLHTEVSYSERHPEQIRNRESYFEKHPVQIDGENPYSEKPTKQLDTDDSHAEKVPEQIHHRESHFEKLLEQIDGENSYSEKPTEPLHTRESYSEKAPEQIYHQDTYLEKLPEQIDGENSYSEKPTEPLHTEDSYSERHPEQIYEWDFYSEKPTEPLHTVDSYSERHPEQITNCDFYSEKPADPLHTEDSYSERHPEQIPNCDFYSEKPAQKLDADDSRAEKVPEQIHRRESYFEKLPEQIDGENSYSEKRTEPVHTRDSHSEKVPEQIHHGDAYFENLPKQIDGENSYSEKPTETLHTEDSYSEKVPEQIHHREFYFEKLAEQMDGENSYSEKPAEPLHTEDSHSERHPEQMDSAGSSCPKLTPAHPLAEDSCSEKFPALRRNEDSGCGNAAEQICRENSPFARLPQQIHHGGDFDRQERTTPPHADTRDPRCRKPSPSEKPPEDRQRPHSPCATPSHQAHAEDSSAESEVRRERHAADSFSDDSCRQKPDERRRAHFSVWERLPEQSDAASRQTRSEAFHAGDSYCERKSPHADSPRGLASFRSGFGGMLLRSGVVSLPGSRDRNGRALLTVDAGAAGVWSRPECRVGELLRLMRYYVSTLSLGAPAATVLVDARRAAPAPALLLALEAAREELPARVGRVLVLMDEDRDSAPPAQVEVVTSLECLAQHVDAHQLPQELGGSFRFSHGNWLAFRSRVEQLGTQCEEVIELLQKNIAIMEDTPLPDTQQEAERQLSICRELMGEVVGDGRLARLQREGGASLSLLLLLLREPSGGPSEERRAAAVAAVSRSYQRVDELLHRLVTRNNGRTRQLRFLREFCRTSAAFAQVSSWLEGEGEARLRLLDRSEDSLQALRRNRRDFEDFRSSACARLEEGEAALRGLERWRDARPSELGAYWLRVGSLRAQLEDFRRRLAAAERNIGERLARDRSLDHACGRATESRHRLELRRRHPPITEAAFREMTSPAEEPRDERGARRPSSASDEKMADARSAGDPAGRRPRSSSASAETLPPLLRRLFGGEPRGPRLSSSAGSAPPSSPHPLRKTQSFDCPAAPQACRSDPSAARGGPSRPARGGNTGVFIRGLEVSGAEAGRRDLRAGTESWESDGRKLRHIVEEMVTTEREYVRSLRYVMAHYFPEMERADLPQDLRGKRSVVFGNLEKLLDFHAHVFLEELEACWKHPLRVAHCFLRHQEQLGLYALYSKNKPKSDALLASHGLAFFKRKQRQLGDRMDLCSYLLKPVQRMSKYALLLDDLIKEAGAAQEAERTALRTALAAVKFQLRRGNDLLAMDAIRRCDVNLKEQGRLLRQDRFTVWSGRSKCHRRVFLFDELLLLSKAKKMDGGLDVFEYKRSFKTSDLGLTESRGDDGLRFEIWFRRRTAKNQSLTLQAASADVKCAWTRQLAAILWTQATRNKEARLKEMLSMGVGDKPYLDIRPSAAAISDRAVHDVAGIRGARMRASIAVSASDRAAPFSSAPSSAGLLGSLDLHALRSRTSGGDVEEDQRQRHTASQRSVTSDGSGSTGSDSGCVSSSSPRDPSSASSCSSHKTVSGAHALPV